MKIKSGPVGAMDSALDFESKGCGFESRTGLTFWTLFFWTFLKTQKSEVGVKWNHSGTTDTNLGPVGRGLPGILDFLAVNPSRRTLKNLGKNLKTGNSLKSWHFRIFFWTWKFCFLLKKRTALTGSRTRAARLEGENTNRYTISAVTFMQSVFFVGGNFKIKKIWNCSNCPKKEATVAGLEPATAWSVVRRSSIEPHGPCL